MAIVLISLFAAVPSQAQSVRQFKDPTVIEAVKQVEQSMGKAMVDGEIERLNERLKEIYADDFAIVESDGKMTTKQNLVSDLESFPDKLD